MLLQEQTDERGQVVSPEFQYPLRVECYCKERIRIMKQLALLFQYPLRVECYCKQRKCATSAGDSRVSIPSTGRVLLQARSGPRQPLPEKMFQYPLRVECYCKIVYSERIKPFRAVSIPSTGRVLLQGKHNDCKRPRFQVSIPSTGRVLLQVRRWR